MRLPTLLFLLLLSSYAYFYNAGGPNQIARLNQTRAIATRGTLYSEGIGLHDEDQVRVKGHFYSNKAPGVSLLGVIPFVLFDGCRRALGLDSPKARNIAVHLTIITVVGIPCAVLGVLLYLFLITTHFSPAVAVLTVCGVCLGTSFFPYATMYFGHSLAGTLAFAAFFLLYQASRSWKQGLPATKRVLAAGLLVSGAVLVEYPLAIVALVLSAYFLANRPPWKEMCSWVVAGLVGVAALALYNTLAFGDPLEVSYFNYERLTGRHQFRAHGEGIGGVSWPQWSILQNILWGHARGLIWFCPILVLLLPGAIAVLWRRRDLWRESLACLAVAAGFLAMNAGYGNSILFWGGGNAAGPRLLIPMFPFAALPVASLIALAPAVFVPLVLWSVGTVVMVTSVMPQIPLLYGNPLADFIRPFFLDGRLAIHRGGLIDTELVTSDSIAYNLGKLLGLPGTWSLLPLFLAQGILSLLILNRLRKEGRLTRRATIVTLATTTLFLLLLLGWPLYQQQVPAQPKTGPGVLGRYYFHDCQGDPSIVFRSPDFNFDYRRQIRPVPARMCAQWRSLLQVPSEDTYVLHLNATTGRIWLDGDEVELTRQGEGPLGWGWEATARLGAGPHRLEIEARIAGINSRPWLRWRTAAEPRFYDIPPELLSVTADMTRTEWSPGAALRQRGQVGEPEASEGQPPVKSLGGLDLDNFCRSKGKARSLWKQNPAKFEGRKTWGCEGADKSWKPLSMAEACAFQYNKTAHAKQEQVDVPTSWICVEGTGPSNPPKEWNAANL